MSILFFITIALYSLNILVFSHPLLRIITMLSAVFLHALVSYFILLSDQGWLFNTQNSVLILAWLIAVSVIVFQVRLKIVYLIISVISVVALAWVYLDPQQAIAKPFGWRLDLHILLSLLAYAVLSLSSLVSIALWLQIIKMKSSVFSNRTYGMNSLLKNEEKLFTIISWGWLLLSCALLSGILFVHGFLSKGLEHKIILSALAWFVFALLILGRLTRGWRGKKAIKINLTAMILLVLGYLGSKLVLEYVI